MTNQEIINIAMQQSAIELNCSLDDFTAGENKVFISHTHEEARRYLELPFFCNLVSYGSNIVASADARVADFVLDYINRFGKANFVYCFETPYIYQLASEFEKYAKMPCFMAEYFLPDMTELTKIAMQSAHQSPYEMRILTPPYTDLYVAEWGNALCAKRTELDVLAVGAFDGDTMVGMAGCSADCDSMWQIGIDVLPQYRQMGIASMLTSTLAAEVVKLSKVPFYCAAWSNIRSAKNAVKSGFRPAWVELTSIDKTKALSMLKS